MKSYDELRAEEFALKSLVDSTGWKALLVMVDGQLASRRIELFNTSVRGLEDAFSIAKRQGEMAGLQLAIALPGYQLQALHQLVEDLLESERQAEPQEKGEDLND